MQGSVAIVAAMVNRTFQSSLEVGSHCVQAHMPPMQLAAVQAANQ